MNKVTLRMKLSEFINTDYEQIVMEYIDNCHKRQPFFLHFWCNENEIDVDTINKFADKNKDKLHIRTVIKSTAELKNGEFIWFDIIRKEDDISDGGNKRRFVSYYESPEELLTSLKAFSDCAVFCCGEKPKKQKRNDYESSNSRK